MSMKRKALIGLSAFATLAGLISGGPAQAQMVQTKPVESALNAVGFIVTYKAGIDAIAPNGQPTGENYAGVDLENSRNIGGNLYAIDFARDLTREQALAALDGLKSDPRVASVEFDRYVFTANLKPQPIAPQILPSPKPIELPIIMKTAITRASLPAITATDTWVSGTTPRVTVNWTKPTTKYSGTIVGYRVQIYATGYWRTLKSQTYSSARSYTTTTSYMKAGSASKFRVAAITKYNGSYYVGYYRYATITPTTAPKSVNVLSVRNNLGDLQFGWTPYTSVIYMGGYPTVDYSIVVKKPDGSEISCTPTSNGCNLVLPVSGTTYTATLTVANEKGFITVSKSFFYTTSIAVNAANDSFFSKQWYLKSSETYSADVSDAWALESGSSDVVVAVVDTGYTDHSDIDSSRILPGYDLISDGSKSNDGNGRDSDAHDPGDYVLVDDPATTYDDRQNSSWHGTHVLGIVGASDNNEGVVGVAPNVNLVPVRVLGPEGGTVSDIIAGIKWAAGIHISGVPDNSNPANVINLSIGGSSAGCDSATESALAAAKEKGITVVTAAGNDNGLGTRSYPGNCYPTINIGASGKQGKPTFYSNFSQVISGQSVGVDLSAPGGDYCQPDATGQIYSTMNDGTTSPAGESYAYELGTSMAAPVVSGVVALLYSAKLRQNPSTTLNSAFVEKIWDALSTTATPFASQSPSHCSGAASSNPTDGSQYGGYGAGIVNAEAAVNAILTTP